MVHIRLSVQLVPEARLASLLRPRIVPAPPGPGFISAGLVRRCVAGVEGDEGGILDHSFPYPEPLRVQLPLQLVPDQLILPGPLQTLLELPDGAVVWGLLRVAEEVLETEAGVFLALQLRALRLYQALTPS